jgi:electron transfer flavoprotein alpha subunit
MFAKLVKSNSGALARSHTGLLKRFKSTLIIVEHDNQKLNPSTLNTITAASKIPKNESITCLVAGTDCGKVAEEVAKIAGVSKVLLADDARFKGFMPESFGPLIVSAQKQHNYSHIAANSTAFGKNLLPRVAAVLGKY